MRSFKLQEFGKPLTEIRQEIPNPIGSQVLLEVLACGVCHSDVHLWDGYFDLGDGTRLAARSIVSPPRTLGHEILGRVTAVGRKAQGIAVGDKRVVFPWIGCGTCKVCELGSEHLCNEPRALGIQCDGGFSDYVLVPHSRYLLEYEPLSAEQACTYACSGLTAYSALRKLSPVSTGDSILIIGAGGVGLSGVRLAKGIYDVEPIVAEVDRGKWEIARGAGAREVFDPTVGDALRSLRQATAGGVAGVVDFVGSGPSFAFGFGALRKAGTLVSVGLFGGTTKISPALLAMKAATVIGSYVGSLEEMQDLMRIARAGHLPPLPVVTRSLDSVNDVLSQLKQGSVCGRFVIRP